MASGRRLKCCCWYVATVKTVRIPTYKRKWPVSPGFCVAWLTVVSDMCRTYCDAANNVRAACWTLTTVCVLVGRIGSFFGGCCSMLRLDRGAVCGSGS